MTDLSIIVADDLAQEHGNEAHARYNSLVRHLVSLGRALERTRSAVAPEPDPGTSA